MKLQSKNDRYDMSLKINEATLTEVMVTLLALFAKNAKAAWTLTRSSLPLSVHLRRVSTGKNSATSHGIEYRTTDSGKVLVPQIWISEEADIATATRLLGRILLQIATGAKKNEKSGRMTFKRSGYKDLLASVGMTGKQANPTFDAPLAREVKAYLDEMQKVRGKYVPTHAPARETNKSGTSKVSFEVNVAGGTAVKLYGLPKEIAAFAAMVESGAALLLTIDKDTLKEASRETQRSKSIADKRANKATNKAARKASPKSNGKTNGTTIPPAVESAPVDASIQ
jgi:hypothetical protein